MLVEERKERKRFPGTSHADTRDTPSHILPNVHSCGVVAAEPGILA